MSYVLLIIKLLPEVIALAKECINLVQEAAGWVDKKQKLSDITQAIKVARETKDTSKLQAIFSGEPVPAKPAAQ